MSKLWELVDGPVCERCKGPLLGFQYCTACGSINPHFHSQSPEAESSYMTGQLEDCLTGHKKGLEEARANKELYAQAQYCGFCGSHVFTPEKLGGG